LENVTHCGLLIEKSTRSAYPVTVFETLPSVDKSTMPPMETMEISLLEHARPMLMAIATKMIGKDIQSKLGASDIVQQTMLEAFLAVDVLDLRKSAHMDGWLRSLLVNNVKDAAKYFRDRLKRSVLRERRVRSFDRIALRLCNPNEGMACEEQIERMHEAMQCIPEAHRQVLSWRFLDQLSCAEIGQLTGRHENAVRMMVNRSLARVKREMRRRDDTFVC